MRFINAEQCWAGLGWAGLGWAGVSAEMTGAGVLQEPPTMTLDAPRWERNFYVIMCSNSAHCHSAYL